MQGGMARTVRSALHPPAWQNLFHNEVPADPPLISIPENLNRLLPRIHAVARPAATRMWHAMICPVYFRVAGGLHCDHCGGGTNIKGRVLQVGVDIAAREIARWGTCRRAVRWFLPLLGLLLPHNAQE